MSTFANPYWSDCRKADGGAKAIDISLDGDEASEFFNFVLKDGATETWFDNNGANFQLALSSALRSFASLDDATEQVRPLQGSVA